jgi:putative DNA primase/helicase
MRSTDGNKMRSAPKPRFDVSRTAGRWPSILASIGVPASVLSKHNGPCPFCEGKDRFRFTDKDGAGVWICNQCGSGNGFHFVERWASTNFVGACKAVEAVLPDSKVTAEKKPMNYAAKLNGIWKRAVPIDEQSQVRAYLLGRGVLDIPQTREIRSIVNLPYWHERQVIGNYSAMVARVRDGEGRPSTLHVTYLDDGAKADVPSPKKVLSKMGDGAHIRLCDGYQNALALTEGIETGLVVQETSGFPVWAMISAGGLSKFVLPDGVDTVAIYADNDINFTGQRHAYELANKLAMMGVNVSVELPTKAGTDWAD